MREALSEERLTALGQQAAAAKLENMMTIIDLDELTRDELYELAQTTGIEGRSDMNKDELINTLQGA
ncbi:MAG: Rho termination factor N-terminal domain-containing protein [Gemmatimonadetes bacterium]|nr:Rho termination factor N-terminal domain-containing protein [Gemmatimonadota bacterium]